MFPKVYILQGSCPAKRHYKNFLVKENSHQQKPSKPSSIISPNRRIAELKARPLAPHSTSPWGSLCRGLPRPRSIQLAPVRSPSDVRVYHTSSMRTNPSCPHPAKERRLMYTCQHVHTYRCVRESNVVALIVCTFAHCSHIHS